MYIGKSCQPDKRWYAHVRAAIQEEDDYVFHRAIRKHTPKAFEFDILESCASDEEAYNREIYWIATYATFIGDAGSWGYNMTRGGDGIRLNHESEVKRKAAVKAALRTPESRQKRSEASKINWQRPEFRQAMIAAMNDPDNRENLSKQAKLRWEDEDFRRRCTDAVNEPERVQKHRQLMLTLRATEGFIDKQRELWQTPEYIAAQTAGVRTPEHRKLVSEASTLRWQDSDYREKMAESMRKVNDTPESLERKAKMVELYQSGMPQVQIAKIVGRSQAVVSKVLMAAGVTKKSKCVK